MKIYTNENNTATLKLLIAAKLANKNVEIVKATFGDDVFSGPKQLPLFEVDPHLTFFSSNAATQYLFPTLDLSENRQCQQMQEWEATRLQPAVSALVASKTVTSELKQTLGVLLEHINTILDKHEYIVGDKLSSADISIWSTLYPLYYNNDLKQLYLLEYSCLMKWYEDLADSKAFQEAVKQWDGSPNGPFGPSAELGTPEMSTFSPGTPDDDVTGPTPEELQTAKDNWHNGFATLQAPLVREKVPQPVKDRKNILITSSLPYVNNVPHLGNIIGCVLSADIFARYCRMCGYNTLYICGTDEYGTATETKAIEERVTPQEICDKYYAIHAEVYKWFNISFDHFGRTTTKEQKEIAQSLFLKLRSNGFISSQTVDQLFCEKCQRFLADRFVEGTCPHPGCLYDNARGDQCDKCGKLINAIDLIEPKCKVCSHKPIVKPSEQLFLDLPQLEPAIRSWVCGVERQWSGPARAVARSWLREPMRSRAITRDLKWGVPVPLDNYRDKVFYVWFDAPIGYLSITQCATKDYEKWWRPGKEHKVKLYQFMAKDNVPFHAIMFPATVIGINEGHLLVEHLFATEYLNYEQGKFSKSRGVGVFGTDVQDTNIPSDVWRFYLASVRPEGSDSAFSWKELGQRNNSELLNNLGNFFHRSLTFCSNMYERKLPEIALNQTDYELVALINREIVAYVNNMEKGRLRDALRHVMAISRLGNQFIQAEQPWVLLKGSEEEQHRAGSVVGFSCQIVALLCILMEPFIPETAEKLRDTLNVDKSTLRINPENPSLVQYLPARHEINKPTPLFSRIESDTLIALQKKFSGTQSEREVETANAKTPKKSQTKKEVGSKSAKESKKEAKGSSTKCEAK